MAGERARSIAVTGSGSGIGAAIARRLAPPDTALLIHAHRNAEIHMSGGIVV